MENADVSCVLPPTLTCTDERDMDAPEGIEAKKDPNRLETPWERENVRLREWKIRFTSALLLKKRFGALADKILYQYKKCLKGLQ